MLSNFKFALMTGIVAGATLLLALPAAGQQNLSERGYEDAQTLNDAVDIVRSQLTLDGKPELAALITEQRVRDAIRTAVHDFDALLAGMDERVLDRKNDWESHIKPACLKMADAGHWPTGSSFNGFYVLKDKDIRRNGLSLRLNVVTTKAQFPALPIADIWFGQFSK